MGDGWQDFSSLVAGGNGIIYAVNPNGTMLWYRHSGFRDGNVGPASWSGPRTVGTGWDSFTTIFSAGSGIIYGIQPNGDLLWYRHLGAADGSFAWDGPIRVGTGWQDFTNVFSPGEGIIYAVQPDGAFLYYRHITWNEALADCTWDGPAQIGTGWQGFAAVLTLAPDSV